VIPRNAKVLVLCAVTSVAGACASSPQSHFYTLTATASSGGPPSQLSLVVGPVSIPPVVDRPEIVVRTGHNQVSIDEFNRWASPLADNLAIVMVDDLVVLLNTPKVTLFSQTAAVEADYQVSIEVQRFESVMGESAYLEAVWTVRRGKAGAKHTGRTLARELVSGPGYPALVAAHSRAAGRLSQDIAAALRTMEQARAGAPPRDAFSAVGADARRRVELAWPWGRASAA
jgi:hypothetical protein